MMNDKDYTIYLTIKAVNILFDYADSFEIHPNAWTVSSYFERLGIAMIDNIEDKRRFENDKKMTKELESFWKLLLSLEKEMEEELQKRLNL